MSNPNEPHYRLYLTRVELQFLFDLINASGVSFPYRSARTAVNIGEDLENALKADPSVIPAKDIPLPATGAASPAALAAAAAPIAPAANGTAA
jgi:hypothetical protein